MNRPPIDLIKKTLTKVTLPWTASGNIPFYVDVRKPRESLSKHDSDRPTFWHYDDGEYLLTCANLMPELIAYIEDLEEKLTKIKY